MSFRIEPDGQRSRFVIHGLACDRTQHPQCSAEKKTTYPSGIVYTLDVREVVQLDNCKAEDYQVWMVLDNKKSPCLLGASVRIEKRRRDARCLNGGDYQRRRFPEQPCRCTEDDKMCDYGFRQVGTGENKACSGIRQRIPKCEVSERTYLAPKREMIGRLAHRERSLRRRRRRKAHCAWRHMSKSE